MRIRLVVVLVLGLMAQQSSRALAQDGSYSVYGPTVTSCGAWTAASGPQRQVYSWWVLGFVSGADYASRSGERALAETDSAGIQEWITKYCSDRPLDTLIKAAISLVDELVGRAKAKR